MIIKFDHISYVANRERKEEIINNHSFLFKEDELENIENKRSLMKFQNDTHDLYFENYNILPIEYILYEKTFKNSNNLNIFCNTISGKYNNLEKATTFLKSMFGNATVDDNKLHCEISGILDKNKVLLELTESEYEKVYLDQEGYGNPAIMCNTLPNVVNGNITELNSIIVNGKELNICFVKPDNINVIFEVILYSGEKKKK